MMHSFSLPLGNGALRRAVARFSVATVLAATSLAAAVPGSVALTHVHVVDVTAAAVQRDRTVLISGNRIVAIGATNATPPPAGYIVVDGKGKYLMPGLWDMHVHLGNATEAALPMFIAAGVTGVRDMGSPDLALLRRWQVEALRAERTSPRIVASGRILDGEADANRILVQNPEEGRAAVARLAGEGVDFIKVHEHLTRETYLAIADETKRRGLTFSGHVPVGENGYLVPGAEAAEAGQRVLEHMFGIPLGRDKTWPDMVAALKRHGTWVNPTLLVFWNRAHLAELKAQDDPRLAAIAPALKEFWATQAAGFGPNAAGPELMLRARMRGLKELVAAGIPILAGTDLGFYRVLPGDLHRELELLVEAGLSPAEALRAATSEAARCLGREADFGTVEKGKIADLVLVEANPLADIRNTAKVAAVIFDGRVIEVTTLRTQLGFNPPAQTPPAK